MLDTSGISVCFGNVQDPVLLENAKLALLEMGAKWSDNIQIDTPNFVCTTPQRRLQLVRTSLEMPAGRLVLPINEPCN